MLDPESLDLDELCTALEDHSPERVWWINTADGRVQSADPAEEGWHEIGSVGSHEGYRDMSEFVAGVHHRRAAELLDPPELQPAIASAAAAVPATAPSAADLFLSPTAGTPSARVNSCGQTWCV